MKYNKYGKNLPVEDSFQAFLVSNAKFTKKEEYPIIPIEMVSKNIPVKILPFSKAINFKGDLSNTFICTYEADSSFERVRKNPKKYISFFKRTAGIIGFDYSIHTDMPLIKQKSQINDNLSLTYFFGDNGIPVIPNIRCGTDELINEFITAIPKNSIIALGVHGFYKYRFEKYEWYCFLEKILPKIQPIKIIVYGSLNDPMYDVFKEKYDFHFYTPWIYNHRKDAVENVN